MSATIDLDPPSFPETLRRVMAAKQVSQAKLARRIRVHASLVSKYCRDRTPPEARMAGLCRALGLTPSDEEWQALYASAGYPSPQRDGRADRSAVVNPSPPSRETATSAGASHGADSGWLTQQLLEFLEARDWQYGRSPSTGTFFLPFAGATLLASCDDEDSEVRMAASLSEMLPAPSDTEQRLHVLELLAHFNYRKYSTASTDLEDGEIRVERTVALGGPVALPNSFFERMVGGTMADVRVLTAALRELLYRGADPAEALARADKQHEE